MRIDRTEWRDKNVFVISLILSKRAIPIFWQILSKRGRSNIKKQQNLILPVLQIFKNYQIITPLMSNWVSANAKTLMWQDFSRLGYVFEFISETHGSNP
ncbi:MAG TPA: hypothetical protein V6D12_22395 [Candidatus Obscuribacterales bacterium]